MSAARRYFATPKGYLTVLRRGGDNVVAFLKANTRAEDITSASVTEVGFVEEARFDCEKGGDDPGDFHRFEITNLTGQIFARGIVSKAGTGSPDKIAGDLTSNLIDDVVLSPSVVAYPVELQEGGFTYAKAS